MFSFYMSLSITLNMFDEISVQTITLAETRLLSRALL